VPAAEQQTILLRTNGQAKTGEVTLRDFDQGVVETLGAEIIPDSNGAAKYWLTKIPGCAPPPGSPGIPVVFANPEDVYQAYKLPVLLVRREDISAAMERWNPGTGTYRVPADGAEAITVPSPGGNLLGHTLYEEQQQAVPFDLTYTLQVEARYHAHLLNQANSLLKYILRVYTPYCRVLVLDSLKDVRSYDAFMEGVSNLDEALDVSERKFGFAVTLRVKAELDLADPEVHRAVTSLPTIRTSPL